jgi:lysine-specific demethylase 8
MTQQLEHQQARPKRVSGSPSAGPKYVPIEEVAGDIPPEEFRKRYALPGKPVVLRGLKWPALPGWSFEHAKKLYKGKGKTRGYVDLPSTGNPYLHAAADHEAQIHLPSFIDTIADPSIAPRYYIARILPPHADWGRELLEGLEFPKYPPRRLMKGHLWIGSAGTRSGLHWDYSDNLYCQVLGKKSFQIVAPEDVECVYPNIANLDNSRVDLDELDLEKFPKLARATIHETTLGPGDGFYLPTAWWHSVISLTPSISINCVWLSKRNQVYLLKVLKTNGRPSVSHLLKSFVFQGMLRNPSRRLLFSPPPTGEALYLEVASAITRMLLRQKG